TSRRLAGGALFCPRRAWASQGLSSWLASSSSSPPDLIDASPKRPVCAHRLRSARYWAVTKVTRRSAATGEDNLELLESGTAFRSATEYRLTSQEPPVL